MDERVRVQATGLVERLQVSLGMRVAFATVIQNEGNIHLKGLYFQPAAEYLSPRRHRSLWQLDEPVREALLRHPIIRTVSLHDAVAFLDRPTNARTVTEMYRQVFGEPLLGQEVLEGFYQLLDRQAGLQKKQLQLLRQVQDPFVTHNERSGGLALLQAVVMSQTARLPRFSDVLDAGLHDQYLEQVRAGVRDSVPWETGRFHGERPLTEVIADTASASRRWGRGSSGKQEDFDREGKAWCQENHAACWRDVPSPQNEMLAERELDEFRL